MVEVCGQVGVLRGCIELPISIIRTKYRALPIAVWRLCFYGAFNKITILH